MADQHQPTPLDSLLNVRLGMLHRSSGRRDFKDAKGPSTDVLVGNMKRGDLLKEIEERLRSVKEIEEDEDEWSD